MELGQKEKLVVGQNTIDYINSVESVLLKDSFCFLSNQTPEKTHAIMSTSTFIKQMSTCPTTTISQISVQTHGKKKKRKVKNPGKVVTDDTNILTCR